MQKEPYNYDVILKLKIISLRKSKINIIYIIDIAHS